MRIKISRGSSFQRLQRTPTPLGIFLFMSVVRAFQDKLLSMYMPQYLVCIKIGTVVLLIVIMLSSVSMTFDVDGEA